jgi:hypothetical protein
MRCFKKVFKNDAFLPGKLFSKQFIISWWLNQNDAVANNFIKHHHKSAAEE